MKGLNLLLCFLALFVVVAMCHQGRQFTIWSPVRTTPESSNMFSYRPCKVNATTSSLFDKCIANGTLISYSLLYDEFFFTPAISNPNSYKNFEKKPVHAPSHVNKQLYTKLSHLWKSMDEHRPYPADQCYTIYIDVNSASGDLILGLRSRGFTSDPVVAQRDPFVGFRRLAAVDNQSPGSFVTGIIERNNTLSIENSERATACNFGTATSCPSDIVTNFRLSIEVCNKTTIQFIPELPLGADRDNLASVNRYTKQTTVFDMDLRGTFEEKREIHIDILNGEGEAEFFSITTKVLPTKFEDAGVDDKRNLYSVVLGGDNLNPANWDADWASNSGGVFQTDECGTKLNFDSKTPQVSDTEDFLELMCYKFPTNLQNDTDYLIDLGLWAEPSPALRSKFHSVAIGVKSGDTFLGFNRRGFMNNRLGDVITAKVNSRGLFNVKETHSVLQYKPIDGSILRSQSTAAFFNVKISVYGKDCVGEQQGVSVFAGTPDCPPYSFVWDTLGQKPFNWAAEDLSICVYQQSKIRVTDCIDESDTQWVKEFLPQSSNIYGLTASIEKAHFGCDGIDLSGIEKDACGVCGGCNECVGCDDVPHSGLVFDKCGVCNGTGSTCCADVCGVDDHVWDWLLVPHIIDDVIERFTMLSEELDTTCNLLGKYNDLCDKNPNVVTAFASVDLANHISEGRKWRSTCLQTFSDCVTSMSKNISDFVPLAF